jgi:glycosyltransferase involved in cell wall biosynthesis
LFIGSLAQLYKGPDVLIDAVALLPETLQLDVTMVGKGVHREALEQRAHARGQAHRIHFVGLLPPGPESIRAALDQADLFVLPSRTEGLPRVIVEALARATPCVATRVGGVPELLAPEDLVASDAVRPLADKLTEVLTAPQRLTEMSARNLATARRYHADVLRPRRRQFYEVVRDRCGGR